VERKEKLEKLHKKNLQELEEKDERTKKLSYQALRDIDKMEQRLLGMEHRLKGIGVDTNLTEDELCEKHAISKPLVSSKPGVNHAVSKPDFDVITDTDKMERKLIGIQEKLNGMESLLNTCEHVVCSAGDSASTKEVKPVTLDVKNFEVLGFKVLSLEEEASGMYELNLLPVTTDIVSFPTIFYVCVFVILFYSLVACIHFKYI